jgi:manganese transport protein
LAGCNHSCFLNVNLVADETIALFHTDISWIAKAGIILVILLFIWLFVTMTFYPLLNKKKKQLADMLYGEAVLLENLAINKVQKIAVALDFTKADEKLIAHALAQGNTEVEYQLIHIVESVSARYSNYSSDDAETRKDTERLNSYVSQLIQKGYKATAMLGYTHRVKEIVRLVNESNAEMLIMGAHRHSGIKDYVFGETIEDVRHQLTIPVLIVNVSEKAIPQ